MIFMRYIDNS